MKIKGRKEEIELLGARGNGNNFDDTITPGAYYVNSDTGEGFPSGAYKYGNLIVSASKLDSDVCIEQIYIPDDNRGIYRRDQFWGSGWRKWKRIYDESILTDSTILSSLASALGVGIPRVRALRASGLGYIVFSVSNSYAPKEIKILFNRYGVDCVITLAWGRNTELAHYSIVSSKSNTEVQEGLEVYCSQTQMAIKIATSDSWAVAEGVSYGAGMTVNQYESYDTTGMTQIL